MNRAESAGNHAGFPLPNATPFAAICYVRSTSTPAVCSAQIAAIPGWRGERDLCIVVRPYGGCRGAREMARHGQGHIQLKF